MVLRRLVKIYFTIIVILVASLNSSGFLNFGSVANFIFPQGDNNFHIVNLENREKEKILSLQEAFITGSAYFTDGENQYLGYIHAIEINIAEYFSTLKVVNLSNFSNLYEVDLPFFDHKINGTVIYDGLTVHYKDNQPIFSTIVQIGTTQSNEKTGIMRFLLNGSILDMIDYNLTNYPFAKLHDIHAVDSNEYLVLTSIEKSEILDTEVSHIMTYDFHGNASNLVHLEKGVRSLTYDPISDSIFTSTRNSKLIDQRNSKGELIRTVNVNIESSEIDLINSTHLILREYQENRLNLYYALGVSIMIFFLIPISLQKLKV